MGFSCTWQYHSPVNQRVPLCTIVYLGNQNVTSVCTKLGIFFMRVKEKYSIHVEIDHFVL